MTKAEMQEHRVQYTRLIGRVRTALSERHYKDAIKLSHSSWEHIDGMLQAEQKDGVTTVDCIEGFSIVLDYAPRLLHYHSLDALKKRLGECRRAGRMCSLDLCAQMEEAEDALRRAHRLWSLLEAEGSVSISSLPGSLGSTAAQWKALIEAWLSMEVLGSEATAGAVRIWLQSSMGRIVKAKCNRCGALVDGPVAIFLDQLTCPECRSEAVFTLIGRPAQE